jgi:hypothetical protein
MDALTWTDERRATTVRRKPPRPQRWLRFSAGSDGKHRRANEAVPTDVFIEATFPDGDTAPWFDDWWWLDCLARWKDERVTFHILPTPAALLHPVVHHHTGMVRRVAPSWRVVAHVYLDELDLDNAPEAIARSPYHDVRVIDAPMPGTDNREVHKAPKLEDVLGTVRRAQRQLGATLPTLARTTEPPDAGFDWSQETA